MPAVWPPAFLIVFRTILICAVYIFYLHLKAKMRILFSLLSNNNPIGGGNMRLWEEKIALPRFPQLQGEAKTDVLIVGGGITGILCAHMLHEQGVDYLLAEGRRIGSGTTAGTTAVITAQHSDVYTKMVKRFGKEVARGYLAANMNAFHAYQALSERYDFDYEEKPSYLYSMTDKQALMTEAATLKELGAQAEYTEDCGLPFDVAGAVRFPQAAQMHPLKLLGALSKNLHIKENAHIIDVKGKTAYTNNGKIHAKKIIIAAHYPFLKMKGLYPLKLYQKRSFVVALAHAPMLPGTYVDMQPRGMYLRNYKDLLIVGGGDARTGTAQDGFQLVRSFVHGVFPDAREKYAWAAQDCISLDEIPYIGAYSDALPHVYLASGFNEWGITSAMAAASILTDLVMERENEYAEIFSPARSMLRPQLALNAAETIKNFFTPKAKRCSHLGCALKHNRDENTWDCPCHGSRFDEHGRIIDNPAIKNAKV